MSCALLWEEDLLPGLLLIPLEREKRINRESQGGESEDEIPEGEKGKEKVQDQRT